MLASTLPGSRGEPPVRSTADFLQAHSTLPWLWAVDGKVSSGVASATWRLYAVRRQSQGRAVHMPLLQHASLDVHRKILKEVRGGGDLQEIEQHPMPPNWIMATPTPEHRFSQVSFRSSQGEIPETKIL
jgi:hypothetical protein